MTQPESNDEMIRMLQALSDPDRLKLIAGLMKGEYSPAELASELKKDIAAVLADLNLLEKAGLVFQVGSGSEQSYRFNRKNYEAFARTRLASKQPPLDLTNLSIAEEEKRVLKNYLNRDGSLKSLPSQEKRLAVILKYVAGAIESGKSYTEHEISVILRRFHPDTTSLRRLLVEHQLLHRERDGARYWVPDSPS